MRVVMQLKHKYAKYTGVAAAVLYLQRQVPAIFSVYDKDPPANGITAIRLD